jgi:hypothetical protein
VQLDVARPRGELLQLGPEALVELDHVKMGDGGGEPLAQRPSPAPDLEHDVAAPDPRVADDRVEQVGIPEEVLAEPPLAGARPRRAHHPKTLAALASTARSSSA